jgi:signal peptide peptidase SppA
MGIGTVLGFRKRPPTVAVVRFDGVIAARRSRLTISLASHAAALDRAVRVKGLAALAIVVNSPGGAPVQSALLYRRIRALAEEHGVPVVAFAEDLAASGGYWLALAGDEIYAEETSLVGSIGVISAGFGFPRLLDRLGIERRVHTAGENKSLLDPFRPENADDVARLIALQEDIHQSFKDHVLRRRAGKIDAADATLFSGEVLTGRMALARGLVDGIGDLRSVMRARFGDTVRLVPVVSERRRWRPWSRPRPFAAEMPDLLGEITDWIEARLIWSRYDL